MAAILSLLEEITAKKKKIKLIKLNYTNKNKFYAIFHSFMIEKLNQRAYKR